jgi:hypothetical protein
VLQSNGLSHYPPSWRVNEIWDNAYKTAASLPHCNPDQVYHDLLKLAKVAYLHFYDSLDGLAPIPALKNEGVDCSRESTPTMNTYGYHRKFNDGNGKSITMNSHLKIGELGIYFELDKNARKVYIGYCGKHLPTVDYN